MIELNSFDLPISLVDREIEALKEQEEQRKAQRPWEAESEDDFEATAKRRLTLGLLLNEVVDKHEIKPDQAKVKEIIQQRASAFAEPEMIVRAYFENENLLREVSELTIEEQAIEKLLENAHLEFPIGFL